MKLAASLKTLFSLSLAITASALSIHAAESASATISATQLSSGMWQYNLVLTDTGTTNVGTFWLSWIPGENFMPVSPTSITAPASWTPMVTGGGYGDGYAIQWVANSGAVVTPGQTLSGFSFESTASPTTMAGNSPFYPTPILTSFVYSGSPFSDNGYQFLTQQVTTTPPPDVTINNGGVVPVYSASTTIQPGSWISIYGSNLAGANATWNGDFPIKLGGTSVTINNKPGYLWFVSSGQINLQAPDDTAMGTVPVVVTTASGSATTTVTLAQFGPSFSLFDSTHVAGIIVRTDGSGAYGGGTYDKLGPTGTSLGFPTVAAQPGDTVELFGVGFGATNPVIPAGQVYSGPSQGAPAVNTIGIMIGGTIVTPGFAGLTEAGLFQFNLTIPEGLGTGDVALTGLVGGLQTPPGVVISLASAAPAPDPNPYPYSTKP